MYIMPKSIEKENPDFFGKVMEKKVKSLSVIPT